MKLCNKQHINLDKNTCTNFVSIEDIKTFHGDKFFEQFKIFIKNKPILLFGQIEGYYFVDYEFAARQTDSFLFPSG